MGNLRHRERSISSGAATWADPEVSGALRGCRALPLQSYLQDSAVEICSQPQRKSGPTLDLNTDLLNHHDLLDRAGKVEADDLDSISNSVTGEGEGINSSSLCISFPICKVGIVICTNKAL